MGACSKSNSPSELVLVLRVNVDSAACRVTVALAMGWCWGSWTTPWTLANTVARAGMDADRTRAAKRMKFKRRMSANLRTGRGSAGPAVRLRRVQTDWRLRLWDAVPDKD